MAEESSSLAMLMFVPHAENTQGLNAHSLVYRSFHEGSLLAVYFFDTFDARERYLIWCDANGRSVPLMELMDCRRAISSEVDEHKPFISELG